MKIRYEPEQVTGEPAIHALSALYPPAQEYSTWAAGETKDIPDDLTVPFKESGRRFRIRLVDELLSNPDFVLANGTNPNYTCTRCGVLSRQEGVVHPFNRMSEVLYPLEIDGERVCNPCFDAALPHWTMDGVTFPQDSSAKSVTVGHSKGQS